MQHRVAREQLISRGSGRNRARLAGVGQAISVGNSEREAAAAACGRAGGGAGGRRGDAEEGFAGPWHLPRRGAAIAAAHDEVWLGWRLG